MKTKSLLLGAAALMATLAGSTLAQAVTAVADNITEDATGLHTTIPNAQVTGPQDNWTVTLTDGSIFIGPPANNNLLPREMTVDEPATESGDINIITFSADQKSLNWRSDLSPQLTPDVLGPTLFVQQPNGNVVGVILSDVADPAGVPDQTCSVLLLSMGLLGLFFVPRAAATRPS